MALTLSQVKQGFSEAGYICDESVLLTVYLSLSMEKPLLVEGAPGVGKTELGKVLARVLNTGLIRLQCYEGLDSKILTRTICSLARYIYKAAYP
jgi:MoxR-like ATPase